MAIAQVMIVLNETVEQFFCSGSPHLLEFKRFYLREPTTHGALIEPYFPGLFTINKRIGGCAFFRRQPDMSGPVQLEHQTPADHILKGAVGLDPVPGQAQFFR